MVEEGKTTYLLKVPSEVWRDMKYVIWNHMTIQDILNALIEEFNSDPELQERIKNKIGE
jgi:hypothetical protein